MNCNNAVYLICLFRIGDQVDIATSAKVSILGAKSLLPFSAWLFQGCTRMLIYHSRKPVLLGKWPLFQVCSYGVVTFNKH